MSHLRQPVTRPPDASDAARELRRFRDALVRGDGATALLTQWVAAREGEAGIRIAAMIRATRCDVLPPGMVERLQVGRAEDISYRRVWLVHGGRVYSRAENWFVFARIGEEAAARLRDGATPFGAAIAGLRPSRETLASEPLWTGEPDETAPDARPPAWILRHRALVRAGDGVPLCEVDEVYSRNLVV